MLQISGCVPVETQEGANSAAGDGAENRAMAAKLSLPFNAPGADISEHKEQCDKLRGNYLRQGMAGNYMCILSFGDAGKKCSKASDCIGSCILRGNDHLTTETKPIGQCIENNSPFGCFATIDDSGKATPMLCRD